MKKVVQFGAGNIGRGFTGQLFYESGYEVVFVDIRREIIDLLNKKRSYTLRIVGDAPQEITIKNVRCVNSDDAGTVINEIESADLVSTAVGSNVLKFTAPLIAKGFERRIEKNDLKELNIIICENLMNAGQIFKSMVFENMNNEARKFIDAKLGFVEAVVSRMVPVIPKELAINDPLLVLAEPYKELPVNKLGFRGAIPEIVGVKPIENFHAYEERKLFTHNAGHAISAYLGYQKKYTYIYEALKDAEIRKIVLGAMMDESGKALVKKHNFEPLDYKSHVEDLLKRFSSVALGDTVERVAKDPLRKLKFSDRLIGAANLAIEYGIKPDNLVKGIKAALFYDNKNDASSRELQKFIRENGLEWVLSNVCGLPKESKLFKTIKES